MVKVLGIAFSARKEGNCLSCVGYCLDRFGENGFDVELLNAYDREITPCSHCKYECFSELLSCPIDDDVPEMYRKLGEADIALFGVPTYGGHASGIYRAFKERMQALDTKEHKWDFWDMPKGFVIVGNLSACGDMVLHEVLYDFHNLKGRPEAVLLSARDFGRRSLDGDLLTSPAVRQRLDGLVEMLCKRVDG